MDFDQVRKLTIIALFSDDELLERLVLKGGNALSLVYHFTPRSSFDLDFSLAGDLTEIPDAQHRIFRALHDRFDAAGFVLFDEKFEAKPKALGENQSPTWGGYQISFKLIAKEKFEALAARSRI